MLKRYFWGAALIVLGILVAVQTIGQIYLGLAFWPVILVLLGLSFLEDSVERRISWGKMALGAWVTGIGLFEILANAGITALDGGDIAWNGWPVMVVALGLRLLFGRRRGFVY